jgi:hypothetical protein
MIGSTMAEKRLSRRSEVEDYLSVVVSFVFCEPR